MEIISEQLDEPVQNIEWSKVYNNVLSPIRAHKNRAKIRRRKYYCYTRYIRERKLNKTKFDKVMKSLPSDFEYFFNETDNLKKYDKQLWSDYLVKRIRKKAQVDNLADLIISKQREKKIINRVMGIDWRTFCLLPTGEVSVQVKYDKMLPIVKQVRIPNLDVFNYMANNCRKSKVKIKVRCEIDRFVVEDCDIDIVHDDVVSI